MVTIDRCKMFCVCGHDHANHDMLTGGGSTTECQVAGCDCKRWGLDDMSGRTRAVAPLDLANLRALAEAATAVHAKATATTDAEWGTVYEFQRAARSALPRLLDEVERLRAERSADVANLREGHCLAVIPETFIACGEGGNYCSETCRLRKLLAEACSLLESDHRPFAPDGSRGTEQIEREARIAAIRREGGVE